MKPISSQWATSDGLPRHHRVEQRAIGLLRRRGVGVMAGDHIVGQPPKRSRVAPRGEVLERADADVAGGHAGQDGTGQGSLAEHRLAGGHRGEGSGGGHSQRCHSLADDVFA